MARKTFISYKYSESQKLRDDILKVMGDDASYYQGETADSPDQTDNETNTIKENLKDMMFNTSVTIVIISPNMTDSKWIDWEIEYTLKEMKRGETTSRTNGIVGVIAKHNGAYDWLVNYTEREDGCSSSRSFKSSLLYEIINENRFNEKEEKYSCEECKTYNQLSSSYISLIDEDKFLRDHDKYIENAYEKSQNINEYKIVKQVEGGQDV